MAHQEELSTGFKVLAFLLPLVGFVYYFAEKNANPQKAEEALSAALWGFGVGLVLSFAGVI
jgi:hypothetical protein